MSVSDHSRPLTRPGLKRAESELSRKSVGEQLESNIIWNTAHPMYKVMTEQFSDRMREIIAREGVRKGAAQPVLLTIALSSDRFALLQSAYTEFAIKAFPLNSPVHSFWCASVQMGNEWIASMMRRHTDRFVHYGGSVLSHLFRGNHNVHIEMDSCDPGFVHDNHSANLDVYRLYSNPLAVGKELGVQLNVEDYEKLLSGQAWVRCSKGALCTHRAEGMCVDLTRTALAPAQVASAMKQYGAKVAYVMLPYHPEMLLQSEGELPLAGVWYKKSGTHLEFQYPEGVAGVTSFSLEAYAPWLLSHVFKIGDGLRPAYYQLELMHTREFLLFAKLTEIPARSAQEFSVSHALELPQSDGLYLVRSWELESLAADPSKAASWKSIEYLAGRRLVDRVYEFALACKPSDFTRYNVAKQLQIANNRVVLQGTSVTVNPVLTAAQIRQLTYSIYCRAFVDRYEMGTLANELMSALQEYAKFADYSVGTRMSALLWACSAFVWDWTAGIVNDAMRSFFDRLRILMDSIPTARKVLFDTAPVYVKFSGEVRQWRESFGMPFERVVASLAHTQYTPVNAGLIGGLATKILGIGGGATNAVRGVVSALTTVHLRGRVQGYVEGGPVRDVVDMGLASGTVLTAEQQRTLDSVVQVNEMQEPTVVRHHYDLVASAFEEPLDTTTKVDYSVQPDYIGVLSRLHAEACPGVAEQDLHHDTASLSLDSQDRTLAAPYLKLPSYFGDVPKPKRYFESHVHALGVPKRQQTIQELLSSMAARNMSAPNVSMPQENAVMFAEIWQVFLVNACLPDAAMRLKEYQDNPVALCGEDFSAWMKQSTTSSVQQVRADLEANSRALEDMDVGSYIAMLKSDVKPPLSIKPINTRIEPQVIVYHEKPLSALYSSIFRVLVRRFLALLRPNYCVNLLKDMAEVVSFVQKNHSYDETGLKYLENDFSKYDKSQGDFAFGLEEYVFRQLGMSDEMLKKWVDGHVKCSIRSISLGISLHVMYQRKSGDATTAFGNVILNVLSVTYAYKGTDVVWAAFMGDDSLVCARKVAGESEAVQVMAEVFNLQAKYFITDAPYFFSTFLLVDDERRRVSALPDPVKRAERWSMLVNADEPAWEERYVSAVDTLKQYRYRTHTTGLPALLMQRYSVTGETASQAADAIATAIQSYENYRAMWVADAKLFTY